eukprot:843631-Pelagomonas_calceolata.AAC.1
MFELLYLLFKLAGMDQPQADQPNSLAEGLPVQSISKYKSAQGSQPYLAGATSCCKWFPFRFALVMRNVSRFRLRAHTLKVEVAVWDTQNALLCDRCSSDEIEMKLMPFWCAESEMFVLCDQGGLQDEKHAAFL